MKALRLKETCTQYTTTRNRYGDVVLTQVGSLLCLFRNIEGLTEAVHREEKNVTGIFWFAPDATVKIGDVVGIYNQLYRIEGVTVARTRLTSDAVHFLKCTASIMRQVS